MHQTSELAPRGAETAAQGLLAGLQAPTPGYMRAAAAPEDDWDTAVLLASALPLFPSAALPP